MPRASIHRVRTSSAEVMHLSPPPRASTLHCIVEPGVETCLALTLRTSQPLRRLIVEAQQGSVVSIVCIVQGGRAPHVLEQILRLATGARVHCCNVASGNAIDWSLASHVEGNDAVSTVDWIFSARGHDRQHIAARNIFAGRNGGGEITMKGVAEGKAYVTCHGMIEIAEGGQGTNTYLTEDVLMLDPTAKIDAVPGLEIRTNDVKASHSATVSRVTAEDLFYFRSRGIDTETARTMYVEGFLGAIGDNLPAPLRAIVVRHCKRVHERQSRG